MRYVIGVLFAGLYLLIHTVAWGSHPLVTDDTGRQGRGRRQIEVNGQYDSDRDSVNGASPESTGSQIATTLSYGIVENVDLVLSLPYQWGKVKKEKEPCTWQMLYYPPPWGRHCGPERRR